MIWDLPCNGMCEQCEVGTDDCPVQSEAANAVIDSHMEVVKHES